MHERGLAIGVDVGGTKIAAGLMDLGTREVLARRLVETKPQRGGRAVLDDVLLMAAELADDFRCDDWPPVGVGIGLAELVDRAGRPASGATIDWRGVDLEAEFQRACGLRVLLDADVRAAARAEALWGAGVAIESFLYVTVGTGISSSLVVAGEPYLGERGLTGTCASARLLVVGPDGDVLSAPPLEAIASGPAIARRYAEASADSSVDSIEVLARAERGDPLALGVVDCAGRALGAAIAGMVNVLDPERVVIGGGLGLATGPFRDRLVGSFREHVWAEAHRNVPLVSAYLGVDAGLMGAALLTRNL
ncbi:MAG: ROK family protein [Lacipirellulaceae bacterium]